MSQLSDLRALRKFTRLGLNEIGNRIYQCCGVVKAPDGTSIGRLAPSMSFLIDYCGACDAQGTCIIERVILPIHIESDYKEQQLRQQLREIAKCK